MVGKVTLHCTCRLDRGRLTLTFWPSAEARAKGGDAIKAGALILTMEREGKKT